LAKRLIDLRQRILQNRRDPAAASSAAVVVTMAVVMPMLRAAGIPGISRSAGSGDCREIAALRRLIEAIGKLVHAVGARPPELLRAVAQRRGDAGHDLFELRGVFALQVLELRE
jgi:hypothetical protein